MVAAHLVPEQLPEVVLHVAGARIGQPRAGGDAKVGVERRPLVLGADEPLLPHLREHPLAPLERAFDVRPGGQRRRRADESRHEGRLGQAQLARPLDEELA